MDTLQIAPEVQEALLANEPVVALESTVISHGLPQPENIETATSCENAVRDQGAVPATIAVMDGKLRVGLETVDFERLASSASVEKLSVRDLAPALANRATGSTTVAATVLAAGLAKIKVFSTGGIGSVHRNFVATGDVSADLYALAGSDVIVVCSGAKAVLDLPRTREMLETLGVTVVGLKTDSMPGFWYRDSGLAVDVNIDTMEQLVKISATRQDLGLGAGVLLCNPPPEEHALPKEDVEGWINEALSSTPHEQGREVTPYLLSKVAQLSQGKTLAANVALLVANARLAVTAADAMTG